LHLSQQFKWVLWVSTTFPSPTKDFQKISEKQKGAMRRLSEKFCEKDQRKREEEEEQEQCVIATTRVFLITSQTYQMCPILPNSNHQL